jgi:hypothetical protein
MMTHTIVASNTIGNLDTITGFVIGGIAAIVGTMVDIVSIVSVVIGITNITNARRPTSSCSSERRHCHRMHCCH